MMEDAEVSKNPMTGTGLGAVRGNTREIGDWGWGSG